MNRFRQAADCYLRLHSRPTINTDAGQGTVEYALVLGVIVVTVIAAMLAGAPLITDIITTALTAVAGVLT